MAILDTFKKKKSTKKTEKKKETPAIRVAEKIKEKKESAPIVHKIEKKDSSQLAARILKSPHITEKAMSLGKENKYVFKVDSESNKNEIRKEVQELYGVKVESVNIINIPRKKRRLGASEGFKTGFKKAIVKVAEGEKIEIGV